MAQNPFPTFRHTLLSILLVGLSGAGPVAVAGDQAVDKARGFFEKGDIKAAGIELKNALQKDPGNADARVLLGELYLKLGTGPAAEKEFRRAMELGADPSRWRIPLAKALILQGNYSDALLRLDGAVDLPPKQQAEVWAQRGYAQYGLGRMDLAREAFDTALTLDRDQTAATIGLIRFAMDDKDEPRAIQVTDELLTRQPKDVEALLIRAEMFRKEGKNEEAAQRFAQVIEIDPSNIRGYLGHATTMIGQQEFAQAIKDLDAADAIQPDVPMTQYLRGVMDFQNKQWDQAGERLQRVLAAVPNHLQSRLLLGIIKYSTNDFEIADEYLGSVVAAMPDNVQARKVLGATRIKMRDPTKAIEILLPGTSTNDAQLLALLGSAYMLKGDREQGQEWLNRAVEISPDVAALRTQLALSLLAGGETDKAVTELQSAVDLGQDILQADVLLVLAHLKNSRFDEALKASANLEQRKPDNPIPYNLSGLAYLSKGELGAATERFQKALTVDPSFTTAELNLARIDVSANALDAAEARYKRVLEKTPKHLGAMLGLAALAERRSNPPEVIGWLEAAQDANPSATQPGLLLVRFYIAQGDYLKALTVANDLAGRFPKDDAVVQMLARAQTLGGQVADAVRTFDQLTLANPQDPQLHYLAGGAKWKAGNQMAAADSFRKAIAINPDFVDARVALASVLLEAREYDLALEVAKRIQTDVPKSALGFRLEGTIRTQKGEQKGAVAALEAAMNLAAESNIARQLGDAYMKVGRSKDAIKLMQDWLAAHTDDRSAMATLAIFYQTAGQDADAVKLYEALYQGAKTNYVLLNNMAWLYHKMGDPRAEEIARQAYESDPNRPEIADTYGWILFNSGRTEQGLSILQQAYLAYPSQTEIGYHVAVALSGVGRNDEAVKILRKLLRDEPRFPQAQEAKVLLQKLGG
jgi:putative PEP-CTERM system TPR-repeat lipoprotein